MTASYDRIGGGYTTVRRADPRIAAQIRRALEGMGSVLNVGAGAGSYEPGDLEVTAVEPSQRMIDQRSPTAAPVVRAVAEALPFLEDSFDASMSLLSVHHWPDLGRGLLEMRRVTRRRIVLFTFVRGGNPFWLTDDYFPQFVVEDGARFPPISLLAELLDAPVRSEVVPIPYDITDGFLGAYWRRPAAYLDAEVRRGISSFAARRHEDVADGLARLQADLDSGAWQRKHGYWLDREFVDLGCRLVVAELTARRRS